MIFNLKKPLPVADVEPDEPTATMYLYGREAKADETPTAYIGDVGYVGAVLPPLPVWDKEQYPYAVICKYLDVFGSVIGYDIVVSNRPLFMTKDESPNLWQPSGTNSSITMSAKLYLDRTVDDTPPGEWGKWGVPYDSYGPGARWWDEPIWADYDVELCDGFLKPMGETALSASEPIPFELFVYSYNGTVLPALPEWDKTAYPYAQIRGRKLYLSSSLITYDTGTWKYTYSSPYLLANFTYSADAICWGELTENETQPTGYDSSLWSNRNIFDENGNVYIEASAPVPISLPLTIFDGEVTLKQADYMDNASGTIFGVLYGYKVGDTLRITLNGNSAIYRATKVSTFNGVIVGNNGLNGNDTEGVDDGGDILLTYPQQHGSSGWSSYIYIRTPGTHYVKIELIESEVT